MQSNLPKDGLFCVVGPVAYDRSWRPTVEAAVEHGKELAITTYAKKPHPLTLYVVEIRRVLTIGVPEVNVADVEDFFPITPESGPTPDRTFIRPDSLDDDEIPF